MATRETCFPLLLLHDPNVPLEKPFHSSFFLLKTVSFFFFFLLSCGAVSATVLFLPRTTSARARTVFLSSRRQVLWLFPDISALASPAVYAFVFLFSPSASAFESAEFCFFSLPLTVWHAFIRCPGRSNFPFYLLSLPHDCRSKLFPPPRRSQTWYAHRPLPLCAEPATLPLPFYAWQYTGTPLTYATIQERPPPIFFPGGKPPVPFSIFSFLLREVAYRGVPPGIFFPALDRCIGPFFFPLNPRSSIGRVGFSPLGIRWASFPFLRRVCLCLAIVMAY